MNYEQIGKFILEKRKEKKLTQKELAIKIGVTDKAISKWERGQGCPDVSILEVLSKELDCSILELLKGREIKNEVIPIIEADDYIKESFTFNSMNIKNKIKRTLNKFIGILIIFIVLMLAYFNIAQIIYIDKEYTYTINYSDMKDFIKYSDTIDENINIIKNDKGIFNDEDYQKILNNINSYYEDINKVKILKNIKTGKDFTYTINDLRFLKLKGFYISHERQVLDILDKYTDSDTITVYRELTMISELNNTKASYPMSMEPYFTYQYQINISEDIGEDLFGLNNANLGYVVSDLKYEFTKLIYLSELVMEVGDINE